MKICFYANIITAWHLLGLQAYLRNLQKEYNEKITGVVHIQPHPKNGQLIDEKSFEISMVDFIFVNDEKERNEILKHNSTSDDFKVITPNKPEIFLACKIMNVVKSNAVSCVVIDEGVGCYDNSRIRWFKSVYIDTHSVYKALKYTIKKLLEPGIEKIKKIKVEYFTLFKYNKSRLEKNEYVCRAYADIINEINLKTPRIEIDSDRYAILFTNPLEEEGNVKGEDLRDVYQTLKKVLESQGIKLYVRLHPRETLLDKYSGMNVLDEKANSSESLLARLNFKPVYVIGAHSTSLITANIFFNIQAITLGNILYPITRTEYCKDLIKKYENNFKGYALFPQNFDEVAKIVKEEEL